MNPTPSAPPADDLRRVIGFWSGTALIIGITIGSGIFRKPATIAALVPDATLVLSLWVFFGVISLCGALALAELASMLPRTGGIYVYLRLAFGDAAAFVVGWMYLLITSPAAVGALATAGVEFLLVAFGVPAKSVPPWLVPGGAVAIIVALSILNIAGTRAGAAVQSALTVVKVSALLAVIVVGFGASGGSFAQLAAGAGAPVDSAALARAVAGVIWTYDGWVAISMIAGEVRAPEKLLKRIIVAGMAILVALYLGANMAYHYAMLPATMARENVAIATRLMADAVGPAGAVVIGLCMVASVVGAAGANVLAKPRVAYAMARDGLTFSILGHAHPRRATPHVAIAVQGAAAVILVLLLRDFDKLTTYFVVVEWFALIFAVGAVFVLRRRMPQAPRPFRTPLYPWAPLLFVVGTLLGLAAIVWGEWRDGNKSPVYGLFVSACGFPVYALFRRRRGSAPGPSI